MISSNDLGRVPTLGSWLPKQRGIGRFFGWRLFVVFVVGAFTVLSVILGEQAPAHLKWVGVSAVGLGFTSLGTALAYWWERSLADSKNRKEAIRIDADVEDEIQRGSANWRQVIHAVVTLVDNPSPEFVRAAQFTLGNHQVYFESMLMRYASQLDRLGYDSRAFLREKRERLVQMQTNAAEVLIATRDRSALIKIFEAVNPEAIEKALKGTQEDPNSALN